MLVMCKCKDRKNNTDGVAFAMSNVPRTYEEKLKGLKKWMKRMKQLKSPCDVDQFYNKYTLCTPYFYFPYFPYFSSSLLLLFLYSSFFSSLLLLCSLL